MGAAAFPADDTPIERLKIRHDPPDSIVYARAANIDKDVIQRSLFVYGYLHLLAFPIL